MLHLVCSESSSSVLSFLSFLCRGFQFNCIVPGPSILSYKPNDTSEHSIQKREKKTFVTFEISSGKETNQHQSPFRRYTTCEEQNDPLFLSRVATQISNQYNVHVSS